jgi:flavin reductase (DIM6/NTAB) family NADH-FMN oxidoreductase RutF/DNA-binding transcriptional LysR family regulator
MLIRDKFLEGMSRAAATVSVVTTDGPAGRAGVTVSAMSAVSADSAAPSLLVCVHHLSLAARAIVDNGVFCVNVLRDSQSHVSDTFAGRLKTADGDKFACGTWRTLETGSPALSDALVALDCRLTSTVRHGSHFIFIGELAEAVVAESGPSLVYANRAYGSPVAIGAAPASHREAGPESPEHEVVSFGCFSTVAPYLAPRLLAAHAQENPEVSLRVVEGDQGQLLRHLASGEVDLLLTYDFDLPENLNAEVVAEVVPYALLPAMHPLAQQAEVALSDLALEPMILLDLPPSRTYFPSLFTDQGLVPWIRYRSPSFEMVRAMVGNGMGFTLLGTKPASSTTYDGRAVVARPLSTPAAPSRLAIVTRSGRQLSSAADSFIDRVRGQLGAVPAGR